MFLSTISVNKDDEFQFNVLRILHLSAVTIVLQVAKILSRCCFCYLPAGTAGIRYFHRRKHMANHYSTSVCMINYLRKGCVQGHLTSLNFGK